MPLFPKETPYLDNLLTALDNEYLLEDSSCNFPDILTEYDATRWSRNLEFFGAYCKATDNKYTFQEKLKSTNVVIFGLGGVGSNVLYNLAAILNIAFANWKNKPIIFITKDKVAKHHTTLGEEHGEAYANLAMRILRALFHRLPLEVYGR